MCICSSRRLGWRKASGIVWKTLRGNSKGRYMSVAYAAIHRTLRYRGEDTRLYSVALDSGEVFFNRRQPALYDRQARLMAIQEVLPGSYVNVSYRVERGIRLMEAVQLVREPVQAAPFDPVPDDGHL
jgi:hypothetical protein